MKEDFTEYDIKPEAFLNYLRYYGPHFNKKLCDFACEQFSKKEYSKEDIHNTLKPILDSLNDYHKKRDFSGNITALAKAISIGYNNFLLSYKNKINEKEDSMNLSR